MLGSSKSNSWWQAILCWCGIQWESPLESLKGDEWQEEQPQETNRPTVRQMWECKSVGKHPIAKKEKICRIKRKNEAPISELQKHVEKFC